MSVMWGNRRRATGASNSRTTRRATFVSPADRIRADERPVAACTKTTVIWGDAHFSR